MAVYTQLSSDDVIITQDSLISPAWLNGESVLRVEYKSGVTPYGHPSTFTSGQDGLDFSGAASAKQGYTERDLGYNEMHGGAAVFDGDINASPPPNHVFNLVYANKLGAGSYYCNEDEPAKKSAISRILYGQYRSLVYGDENTNFKFNGHEPEDIFVINLNREVYKNGLVPEGLMLLLGHATKDTYLTTDVLSNPNPPKITNIGPQYNVVSGSYGRMDGNTLNQSDNGNKGSYGLFYPDAGIIILNPDALADSDIISESTLTTVRSFNSPNISVNSAYNIIRNAFAEYNTGLSYFELKAKEEIISQNYLIRIPNESYNYTNNQSFIDEKGKVKNLSFVDNPVTFITTIGLYNDQNELIAVAKLSKPLLKDFSKELFIKVKLDF